MGRCVAAAPRWRLPYAKESGRLRLRTSVCRWDLPFAMPRCRHFQSSHTRHDHAAEGKTNKFAQTLYQRIIKLRSVVGRHTNDGLTADPKCEVRNASHFIKMLIFRQNFAHTVIHLINLKRDNFRAQPSGWMWVDSQQAIRGSQTLLACLILLFGRSKLRGHVIACEQTRHETATKNKKKWVLESIAPKMATT